MEKNLGLYSAFASLVTSVIVVFLFYALAMGKVRMDPLVYTTVDVYGGMVFVFILSMIVAASIWPGVIEKRLAKR